MKSISETIKAPEYDFLQTHRHLKNNLMFLVFGGSHAYGTSTPESDVDIRGCAFNSKPDLLGLSNFEQVVEEKTDTTVYSFKKLVGLLINCNPNTIEMLGSKPEHYIIYSPVANQLLANAKMFLSKKAAYSFGGYATQQLRRMQNALARDSYPQAEKERHILGSVKSSMMHFEDRYTKMPEGAIRLTIGKSKREGFETEIYADINLKHYPLREFKGILADVGNVIRDYDKLNNRNKKKDDLHLNKHAMHLIRLYLMCLDILEKETICTYRENDLELLMDIRNGKFQNSDSTYMPEFFDLVTECERRMLYAAENTSLPERPDMKRIEEFVMWVNEGILGVG